MLAHASCRRAVRRRAVRRRAVRRRATCPHAALLATLTALLLTVATPLHAFPDHFAWGHPSPQGNGIFGLAFRDAQQGWAVSGAGTVLATTDGGLHWELRHGPDLVTGDFNDIAVAADGALIAVGEGIHRSTDDGAAWTAIANPAAGELRDLAAIPGGGLSAAGEGGSVVVSFDDGLSWTEVGPGAGVIRHHLWRSASEGYAVGEEVSHRTVDGGQHWDQITDLTFFGFNEVYFTDAQHGTIVEDFATWRSDDGGATWEEHFDATEPLYRYRTVVLSPTHLFTTTFLEGGELWESTDGGETWVQRQNRFVIGFPALTRTPGGRLIWGSDVGDLFWSDDGGQTIANATENLCDTAPSAPIADFLRRPDGVLFAANQPSSANQAQSWLRSDDEGESWTVPAAVPGLRWIDAAAFLDVDHGLAAYRHFLRLTEDGGDSWQEAELATDRRVWSAALVAADRYFLATSSDAGGDLLRSTDGGTSWDPVAGGLPTGNFAAGVVSFADADTGYVAGRVGSALRLYRSTDGGQSWQQLAATGLPAVPSAMHWIDGATGLAAVSVATGSGIYRSTDAGASWDQVDPMRTRTVVFADASHGVAVGFYSDTILATADAGLTWTEQSLPLRGPGPASNTVRVEAAVARSDGWVLGASGNRILVATAGDLTGAGPDDPAQRIPATACRLLGAAPNPFNPVTVLTYALPRAGHVRVTVHDLAGRRVRLLLAGPREAGRHALRWDGRDDAGLAAAAGVYLVRVAGPGGADHGKVTLVK